MSAAGAIVSGSTPILSSCGRNISTLTAARSKLRPSSAPSFTSTNRGCTRNSRVGIAGTRKSTLPSVGLRKTASTWRVPSITWKFVTSQSCRLSSMMNPVPVPSSVAICGTAIWYAAQSTAAGFEPR